MERLDLLDVAFKGFQETESTHWGTEIPEIRNLVEEASNACQINSATVQEPVAATQALREEARRLDAAVQAERAPQ